MAVICSVALDKATFYFDKEYDYCVPKQLVGKVQAGVRVFVPFGKANSGRQGIVLSVHEGSSEKKKSITAVLDEKPLLSEEFIGLIKWVKERTFSTYFDVVRTILPLGLELKTKAFYTAKPVQQDILETLDSNTLEVYRYLKKLGGCIEKDRVLSDLCIDSSSDILEKMTLKGLLIKHNDTVKTLGAHTEKSVRLTASEEELSCIKFTAKQKQVVDFLLQVGSSSVKEVTYFCPVTAAVVNAVVNKGVATFFDNFVYRNPYANLDSDPVCEAITLSKNQQGAYKVLEDCYDKESAQTALLYGVTGSGKTQVYLKLIDKAVVQGKDVIVMVPEISLSTQTLKIFHKRYGSKVAVFHSRLSVGQRADEYKRVLSGDAQIVVGTRSAVFAPFKNLGLIIIDEEQEHTYKSEQSPKYSALEVAKYRCGYNKALLVLSSATPSVESYTYALNGRYAFAKITERYGKGGLPDVMVADMRSDISAQNGSNAISNVLRDELVKNFENEEQSILLINRRGYNTFVCCNTCGTVMTCPHCSISLTYHRANGRLMCHYCGYSVCAKHLVCKECNGTDMRFSGSGTQRIEEEISALLPKARVLRMDMDTTMTKNSHEKMLNAFSSGEYDILLGTQMVAKGLDFPNVSLVGVVNADASLYNYDYRSAETAFDLITQVVGRAGRADKKGRAVIQTMTPENPIISLAEKQDYERFYDGEIKLRRLMTYPPYCDICTLGFMSSNEGYAKDAAEYFLSKLIEKNKGDYKDQKFVVLGPTAALVSKVNNKYRFRIIIKCKNTSRFRSMMSETVIQYFSLSRFKRVSLSIDMNPKNFF